LAASTESGDDLPVVPAVPPSVAADPVVERRADGSLKSVDCRQALVGEDSEPDFGIICEIGVEGVLL
jgi:hypothetical protein